MKAGARKQQILEYDPFLRSGFEENVLGRLSGIGEDKMRERKYGSQTVIYIRVLLKLSMQMPHVRLDGRHLQLSPGVRLEVELNKFVGNIERIEAEIR